MPKSVLKDPADEFDVENDWSAQMTHDTDTLATSEWAVTGALDEDDEPVDGWLQIMSGGGHDDSHTDTTATVWVEGGTHGETYDLVNTVHTAGLRKWERTRPVPVYNR